MFLTVMAFLGCLLMMVLSAFWGEGENITAAIFIAASLVCIALLGVVREIQEKRG